MHGPFKHSHKGLNKRQTTFQGAYRLVEYNSVVSRFSEKCTGTGLAGRVEGIFLHVPQGTSRQSASSIIFDSAPIKAAPPSSSCPPSPTLLHLLSCHRNSTQNHQQSDSTHPGYSDNLLEILTREQYLVPSLGLIIA